MFTLTQRVFWEDTDAGGVVYYANYLRFLERARSEWLRSLGVHQESLRQDPGCQFVVTEVHARYLKPARLDDLITISARLATLDRVRLCFAQDIRRGDEVLLQADVHAACVNAQTLRPMRLPPAISTLLAPSTP
ncbi:tol-pal system-associated acyl-CoA thioesterase [Inhella gelatinilytica]|uniref:Tol-pal system-associated acyl-CoA thioesterase n=1 Tax=Inhella gelatinilytica TaxID=2795030 RepID=A0A931NE79_9BURK|nr:tol-pal system-associated acyl-CoA thioesterase [Inhella gelatinilytica]MBH9552980.1 tol-pal system-associated acyl-CoA thioesterase [Inhella gelatinilytica]